ncbi:hypothetical protein [Photobacterium damselae]|uniref:hypothetical protein n=1 Tax=Photobacterium damselae TaxID=38293 RepID=UPI001F34417E|nr:hypothetical protein [Photobacterium damselae]UKA12951.1 hypothetical protein IHC91_21440 [Photobacterium damselae subsp. damselae]
MNFINPNQPLLDVKAAVKKEFDQPTPRPHLGCSQIGAECRADLWHSFRWNVKAEFDADTHLRFQDGHRSEDVMAAYLRKAGFQLVTHKNGQQIRVSSLGGHFAGSVDGIIKGLPWLHKNEVSIWEHKAVNETKFKKLKGLVDELGPDSLRLALQAWDQVYYAQAQCYMSKLNTTHHWLTCSTPGCRDFVAVRTELDPDFARLMENKAETIITSSEPPAREFDDPFFYKAKWLNSYDILYKNAVPAPNYRNSVFCSPVVDNSDKGIWFDEYLQIAVPVSEQGNNHAHHLFNPCLIPYADCVALEDAAKPRYAVYKLQDGTTFYNVHKGLEGPNGFNSEEMRFLTPEIIKDPNIADIRKNFAAKISG